MSNRAYKIYISLIITIILFSIISSVYASVTVDFYTFPCASGSYWNPSSASNIFRTNYIVTVSGNSITITVEVYNTLNQRYRTGTGTGVIGTPFSINTYYVSPPNTNLFVYPVTSYSDIPVPVDKGNQLVIKDSGASTDLKTLLGNANQYILKDSATNGEVFTAIINSNGIVDLSQVPDGVTLNAKAYDINGNEIAKSFINPIKNPTSSGGGGNPYNQPSTVLPTDKLQITSPSTVSGSSVNYQPTINKTGATVYQLANAPSWLSINSQTGQVTGTPPAGTEAYTFDIIATNYEPNNIEAGYSTEKKTVYGSASSDATTAKTQISQLQQEKQTAAVTTTSDELQKMRQEQNQIFNDMRTYLNSIQNNTAIFNEGGSSLVDLTPLTENSGAPNMEADFDKNSIPNNASVTAPGFVNTALNQRYSNSAPQLVIPLSLASVGSYSFQDYPIDLSEGWISNIVTIMRLFFLMCVTVYFLIQSIKLFRSFEL